MTAAVLDQIRHADEPVPDFTFDEALAASANDLVRIAELQRSPRERREDPGQLPLVARTYSDLASRLEADDPRRSELLLLSASTWSLAGFQANAVAIARQYRDSINYALGVEPLSATETAAAAPAAIAAVAAAVLLRDVDEVARLGSIAAETVRELGQRAVAEAGNRPLDVGDAAVLAAYGLTGRAARCLARFWLFGDEAAGAAARADLRRAADLLLAAGVVDTWALVGNLVAVVEDLVATSPWRLLRGAPSWNGRWVRYLRWLARDDLPLVQVWPSQARVLRAGLLDRSLPNATVTMPTSAGKTNVAEWAILDALADGGTDPFASPLVVYVVPTRALAAQVERHLSETLHRLGLTVSAIFGGWEHVEYELQLIDTTDVLVVTSEKLDLLLRNEPSIIERLRLVVADEGHLLGEGERGLRLEMVLTRLRLFAPRARVLVLSAVLPNTQEVASWLAPDLDRERAIKVAWTPSTLRVGVFMWRGVEQDGQRGVVQYRKDDVESAFFLPYVITRRRKITRLYPSEPKDIAAHLALHYVRIGSVLVAAPRKDSAQAVAKEVLKLLGTPSDEDWQALDPEIQQGRDCVIEAVREYAGSGHPLEAMARAGVGYHHADVPEEVRQAVERAFRSGALTILCSTSTLGQGVNLPAKTVIVEGTWRGRGERLSVREFWNVAGRAARPFLETDGHLVLVSKDNREAKELLRRYVEGEPEPVYSVLCAMYVDLAKQRMPSLLEYDQVPEDIDFFDPEDPEVLSVTDALDLHLLTLLVEEVIDTSDEEQLLVEVSKALGATFGAKQLTLRSAPLAPLARFASRRVRAVVARVPDRELRQAYLRTGLSLAGCESALQAASSLQGRLLEEPDLLSSHRWAEFLRLLIEEAVRVVEAATACGKAGVEATAVPALVVDWIDGLSIDELRTRHGEALGVGRDPMQFATMIDRVVVNTLSWVVSAVVQLLGHLRSETLTGRAPLASAMVKYGVGAEAACYATSIGVRRRHDAVAIAALCPSEASASLTAFLRWVGALVPEDLRQAVSDPTLALFTEKAAALKTPRGLLELSVMGEGIVRTPLRGIRHRASGSMLLSMPVGAELALNRDPANPADPNAIEVKVPGTDATVGFVAKEAARILAPLMDLEAIAGARVRLVGRPDPAEPGSEQHINDYDAVWIEITVSRKEDGGPYDASAA